MATNNPFYYTVRSARKIRPFGELSSSQQKREISAYRRANPGKSERDARRAITDARRHGRLPQYGINGSNEQIARSIVYQDRSQRSREAFEHRGKPIRAIVNIDGRPYVVDVYGTTRSERRNIARHWNYVRAFINGQKDIDYIEDKMKKFDGKRAGIVGTERLRLETHPEGFELLAFTGSLDFESIYEESGIWSEAA